MPQNTAVPTPTQPGADTQGQGSALSAFLSFVKSRMGAAPQGGQPGMASQLPTYAGSPGMVGGAPPNVTGGAAAPGPRPQSGMSIPPPPIQNYEQYEGTKRQIGNPGSLINNIAKTINSFKKDKDQTEFAKAQNSLNMFQNAIAQGDMQVADMLAKDPKIVKSWEKYLKMEFPRQEGTPEMNVPNQKVPTTVPAPPGQLGGVNQPGGIAVPQDMTPEGQLHRMQMEAALKVAGGMSPEQLATGPLGESAMLKPAEQKKATLIKYGLAMSSSDEAQLDASVKTQMSKMQYDALQFLAGQEAQTERQKAVAEIHAGAVKSAAATAAASRLQVGRERMKSMEKLQGLKGSALQLGLYKQQMADNARWASIALSKLNAKDISDEDKAMYKAEYDKYTQRETQVKDDMEGFQMMQKILPELFDGSSNDGGSDVIDATPPSTGE